MLGDLHCVLCTKTNGWQSKGRYKTQEILVKANL